MENFKVKIGIATYNRVKKLERLLASIKNQTLSSKHFDVTILYDYDDAPTVWFLQNNKELNSICFHQKAFVIEKWNTFHEQSGGMAHATLVDDVELDVHCLEKAVNTLLDNYPDYDGVIGLSQECPGQPNYKFQPTGQILVGSKFLDRYPQRHICCPKYVQWYQDEELLTFATELGKFKLCSEAKMIHYHPAYVKGEMDSTHPLSRNEIYLKDTKLHNVRKLSGKIWGKTFD